MVSLSLSKFTKIKLTFNPANSSSRPFAFISAFISFMTSRNIKSSSRNSSLVFASSASIYLIKYQVSQSWTCRSDLLFEKTGSYLNIRDAIVYRRANEHPQVFLLNRHETDYGLSFISTVAHLGFKTPQAHISHAKGTPKLQPDLQVSH
jgi:hypothetical protein